MSRHSPQRHRTWSACRTGWPATASPTSPWRRPASTGSRSGLCCARETSLSCWPTPPRQGRAGPQDGRERRHLAGRLARPRADPALRRNPHSAPNLFRALRTRDIDAAVVFGAPAFLTNGRLAAVPNWVIIYDEPALSRLEFMKRNLRSERHCAVRVRVTHWQRPPLSAPRKKTPRRALVSTFILETVARPR